MIRLARSSPIFPATNSRNSLTVSATGSPCSSTRNPSLYLTSRPSWTSRSATLCFTWTLADASASPSTKAAIPSSSTSPLPAPSTSPAKASPSKPSDDHQKSQHQLTVSRTLTLSAALLPLKQPRNRFHHLIVCLTLAGLCIGKVEQARVLR